jgi:acyl dehydratase
MFFRDFDQLEPGNGFTTRGRTITEADIVMFGSMTGDQHPLHLDAEWAEAHGQFGERIAHGLLVLSYTAGLVHFDPDCVVALRGVDRLVFKAPVRIGDTISVRVEIVALRRAGPQLGLVETSWVVTNQHGDTVMRLTAKLLWRRAAADASVPA